MSSISELHSTLNVIASESLRSYGANHIEIEPVLDALSAYGDLVGEKKNRLDDYRRTLEDRAMGPLFVRYL